MHFGDISTPELRYRNATKISDKTAEIIETWRHFDIRIVRTPKKIAERLGITLRSYSRVHTITYLKYFN